MTPITLFFLATLPQTHSIIGGIPGKINSYPYVVSITRNLEDTKEGLVYIGCGGVLLTVDWIITAGSCIYLDEIDARKVIIAAGSNFEYAYMKETNSLNAKNVQVRDAVKGVRYEPELYFVDKYDIGLIKVEPSFKIVKGSVDLVFVPNSKSKEWMTKCKNVVALGWGQNIIESIPEQVTTVSPNQNYTNSTLGNQNYTTSTIETQTQNYTSSTLGSQNLNYTNLTLEYQNLNYTNSTLGDQSQNQTVDSNVTQSELDPNAPIKNFDPHLQIVDLKLSEIGKCASSWPDYYEHGTDFRDFVFCTDTEGYGVANNETKGVCSGDEGGPIVCHGIVVGIISHLHNDTCSKGNMTQIHAKIDAFYDFFEKIAEVKMPYRLNSKYENSRSAKEEENVKNGSVDLRSDYGINFVCLLLCLLIIK